DVQRAVVEDYRKNKTIDAFIHDSTMPYVDIEVKNVILDDLRQSPYSARVEFLKIYTNPADHSELKRERWTASVTYVFRDGVQNVIKWRGQAHSGITAAGFCPTPSSVFDARLYSVTGSGHIRRPAALGLLLRFSPSWVPVPPKRYSLQNRHRTPSKFLSVPSR